MRKNRSLRSWRFLWVGSPASRARGPKRVAKPRRNWARATRKLRQSRSLTRLRRDCHGSLHILPAAAPLVLARLYRPPKPPATQAKKSRRKRRLWVPIERLIQRIVLTFNCLCLRLNVTHCNSGPEED